MPKHPQPPLTVKQAEAELTEMAYDAQSARRWLPFERNISPDFLECLPEGTSADLVALVLFYYADLRTAASVPHYLDNALLAMLEMRVTRNKSDEAAFVLTAFRSGPHVNEHARLRELLTLTMALKYAGRKSSPKRRATRDGVDAMIANRGDIIAGAQAAVALTPFESYVTSRYVPVLLADASDESLDVLLPFVHHMLVEQGPCLDWSRRVLVPLLADKPKARRLIDMLEDAAVLRTKVSPVDAFAVAIGLDPPPELLQIYVSIDLTDRPLRFQVQIDSTQASWCVVRPTTKAAFRFVDPISELAKQIPATACSYEFKLKPKGLDRKKVHAWLKSMMPMAVPR